MFSCKDQGGGGGTGGRTPPLEIILLPLQNAIVPQSLVHFFKLRTKTIVKTFDRIPLTKYYSSTHALYEKQ